MQLHEIYPKHKLKKRKRIGRGGKRGTYSGKGQKGQKSRAGYNLRPVIRGWIKKYPKLKGYRQKSKIKSKKSKIIILNLDILEKKFSAKGFSASGGEGKIKINPEILLKLGIIHRIKGRMPVVKILGKGKITKKLIVENCQLSKSAKDKIEKAGGTIKV